jgi:hypothetical protein
MLKTSSTLSIAFIAAAIAAVKARDSVFQSPSAPSNEWAARFGSKAAQATALR